MERTAKTESPPIFYANFYNLRKRRRSGGQGGVTSSSTPSEGDAKTKTGQKTSTAATTSKLGRKSRTTARKTSDTPVTTTTTKKEKKKTLTIVAKKRSDAECSPDTFCVEETRDEARCSPLLAENERPPKKRSRLSENESPRVVTPPVTDVTIGGTVEKAASCDESPTRVRYASVTRTEQVSLVKWHKQPPLSKTRIDDESDEIQVVLVKPAEVQCLSTPSLPHRKKMQQVKRSTRSRRPPPTKMPDAVALAASIGAQIDASRDVVAQYIDWLRRGVADLGNLVQFYRAPPPAATSSPDELWSRARLTAREHCALRDTRFDVACLQATRLQWRDELAELESMSRAAQLAHFRRLAAIERVPYERARQQLADLHHLLRCFHPNVDEWFGFERFTLRDVAEWKREPIGKSEPYRNALNKFPGLAKLMYQRYKCRPNPVELELERRGIEYEEVMEELCLITRTCTAPSKSTPRPEYYLPRGVYWRRLCMNIANMFVFDTKTGQWEVNPARGALFNTIFKFVYSDSRGEELFKASGVRERL